MNLFYNKLVIWRTKCWSQRTAKVTSWRACRPNLKNILFFFFLEIWWPLTLRACTAQTDNNAHLQVIIVRTTYNCWPLSRWRLKGILKECRMTSTAAHCRCKWTKIKLVDSNAGKLVQLFRPRGWNWGPAGRHLFIENRGSLQQSCGCYACGSIPSQSCLVGLGNKNLNLSSQFYGRGRGYKTLQAMICRPWASWNGCVSGWIRKCQWGFERRPGMGCACCWGRKKVN